MAPARYLVGITTRSGKVRKDLLEFIFAVNMPFPLSLLSSESSNSEREEQEHIEMAHTLKEFASANLDQQPLCIELDGTIELKPQLIHLIPKFGGVVGEDPNHHLQRFYHVITSIKQATGDSDKALMAALPFSLMDVAGEWLYFLTPGSVTTWAEMKKLFLDSKAARIHKDICGIKQISSENLYEYWERYKKLISGCPYHQISDQLIIYNFYEGLLAHVRAMIDAASGGDLGDKTVIQAKTLIENMASNSQKFSARSDAIVRKVNEVGEGSHIDQRMSSMERMMQLMVAVILLSYNNNTEQVNALFQ